MQSVYVQFVPGHEAKCIQKVQIFPGQERFHMNPPRKISIQGAVTLLPFAQSSVAPGVPLLVCAVEGDETNAVLVLALAPGTADAFP